MSNQESYKSRFQKISITHIHRKEIKGKSIFFFRMNHLSSYVLRMMRDLHSKLDLGKQDNNKKNENDMILQGSHKMRSSLREVMREIVVVVKWNDAWSKEKKLDSIKDLLFYLHICLA